jgi:hypothetical protein
VQRSELEVFIVGEIAEGGGDFNVVSDVELLFTVLFVVDSVIIGGFGFTGSAS